MGRMGQGLGSTEGTNVARVFALALGLGYIAAGAVGFAFTGFTGFVANTDEALLGFDLNIFHNIVHLAIGLGLVVASRMRDVTATQGVLIGVGLFYLLAAVLGFLNYLQIISIDGSLAADNFLHIFTGAAALIFGLIAVRQQNDGSRGDRFRGEGPAAAKGPLPLGQRRGQWDPDETYREEAY